MIFAPRVKYEGLLPDGAGNATPAEPLLAPPGVQGEPKGGGVEVADLASTRTGAGSPDTASQWSGAGRACPFGSQGAGVLQSAGHPLLTVSLAAQALSGDANPPGSPPTLQHHGPGKRVLERSLGLREGEAHQQPTRPGDAHEEVAANQEGEPAKHLPLADVLLIQEAAAHPVGELQVVAHARECIAAAGTAPGALRGSGRFSLPTVK